MNRRRSEALTRIAEERERLAREVHATRARAAAQARAHLEQARTRAQTITAEACRRVHELVELRSRIIEQLGGAHSTLEEVLTALQPVPEERGRIAQPDSATTSAADPASAAAPPGPSRLPRPPRGLRRLPRPPRNPHPPRDRAHRRPPDPTTPHHATAHRARARAPAPSEAGSGRAPAADHAELRHVPVGLDRAFTAPAGPTTARRGCRALPVLAVVGRPNVGKSTLVNRLIAAGRRWCRTSPASPARGKRRSAPALDRSDRVSRRGLVVGADTAAR